MKQFHIALFATIAITMACLSGCKSTEPSEADIFYNEDAATLQQLIADGRLYSLQELKDSFMSEKGNYLSDYSLYRTRTIGKGTADQMYLFSIDTIPSKGPGIYVMGRVSTDDWGGNFYKSMVIQQVEHNGLSIPQQAIRISVDAGSVSGLYPRGQMILIRCNGLAIGRYANQPQLCLPSYNNNVFADKASQKIGWAPGRIPLARFKQATKRIGQPNEDKLVYDTIQLSSYYFSGEISDNTKLMAELKRGRQEDGRLVIVDNIHYSGECLSQQKAPQPCTTGNPADDGTANVFAPTTGNVGYPQSRLIYDATNKNYICVSMSEYAKQANYYLPGATSGNDGDQFILDSTAVENFDYSKPYLMFKPTTKDNGLPIYVSARKEYQGWKENDVVYTNTTMKSDNAYIYTGKEWKAKVIGVLHCSDYSGSVKGILSYYMDNASYYPQSTNWAISICDLSDLTLKKDGVAWVPLEYTPN